MIWILIVLNFHGGVLHLTFPTKEGCEAAVVQVQTMQQAQAVCIKR